MDKNTFDVLKCYVTRQDEDTTHLSWFQKKLCKWFEIPYEKRFIFTIIVEPYVPGNEPQKNDIVLFNNSMSQFVIINVSMLPDPQIVLQAIDPMHQMPPIRKGFIVGNINEQD